MEGSNRIKTWSEFLLLGGMLAGILWMQHRMSKITPMRQNPVVSRSSIPDKFDLKLWYGRLQHESMTIQIDGDKYHKILNDPRSLWSQFDHEKYAASDQSLEEIADAILEADGSNFLTLMSEPNGDSETERIYYPSHFLGEDYVRILDFIFANVKYVADKGQGYAQTPWETLIKGKGDCEDMAYLAAALLRGKRDIAIVYEPHKTKTSGHITIAVKLREGEKPPEGWIHVHKPYLEYALQMLEEDPSLNNIGNVEFTELVFQRHPEILKGKKQAVVIQYGNDRYAVLEATGTAFSITEGIGQFEFRPLN